MKIYKGEHNYSEYWFYIKDDLLYYSTDISDFNFRNHIDKPINIKDIFDNIQDYSFILHKEKMINYKEKTFFQKIIGWIRDKTQNARK